VSHLPLVGNHGVPDRKDSIEKNPSPHTTSLLPWAAQPLPRSGGRTLLPHGLRCGPPRPFSPGHGVPRIPPCPLPPCPCAAPPPPPPPMLRVLFGSATPLGGPAPALHRQLRFKAKASGRSLSRTYGSRKPKFLGLPGGPVRSRLRRLGSPGPRGIPPTDPRGQRSGTASSSRSRCVSSGWGLGLGCRPAAHALDGDPPVKFDAALFSFPCPAQQPIGGIGRR